jgi:ABC-type oligopeptide transport system substrate-binding subunit
LPTLGSGYYIPQYYFANLDVRRAFAYAFNYTNYIDNLLGNSRYGADFGFHYTGILPLGMPGYMNLTQLQQAGAVIPVYNLTIAKQYLEESGEYNTSINIPIVVDSGYPVEFAAVEYWASILNSIDPNIHANAVYLPWDLIDGYLIPNENPMPINLFAWAPDYPFPSDYIVPIYSENGAYALPCGQTPQVLMAAGQPAQATEDTLMNQYITDGLSTGNATLAISYYDKAEVLGVNLTTCTYTAQTNTFLFYSSSLHGVQYEQNAIYNFSGGADTVYIYLSK